VLPVFEQGFIYYTKRGWDGIGCPDAGSDLPTLPPSTTTPHRRSVVAKVKVMLDKANLKHPFSELGQIEAMPLTLEALGTVIGFRQYYCCCSRKLVDPARLLAFEAYVRFNSMPLGCSVPHHPHPIASYHRRCFAILWDWQKVGESAK
jgi:hypothetical protein